MTHASVFSGIGGPEVAAAMLGWKNAFHCEINPFGRAVLDYWFPEAESYEDITKTDFSKWEGQIDVLTGGFPCQPFSFAGKRRGADDDRYLWPYMFRCIDQIRPTWVIGENVGGILTMVERGQVVAVEDTPTLFDEDGAVHRYEYRSTFTLERICRDLETHGYDVQPILIPACAVGAPHRRDRVFIIGHVADTESVGQLDGDRQEREAVSGWPYMAQAQRRVDASVGNGEQGLATNASHTRFQETRAELETTGTWGSYLRDGKWYEVGKRWSAFPTVSPVHRGNDGIPFDVDRLTLPFSKWRTEAIKAYGNAIVPQVMYEIFRAIDEIERGS